jgi:DNA repair protein RadC
MAHELLKLTGGLTGISRANMLDLAGIRGLGPSRIAALMASLELGRRYLEAPGEVRSSLKDPGHAARFFKARLADLPHEVFGGLFLDTRHRLIRYEELFRGTVDGAAVYPREVLKRALDLNASAIIIGHNHPSGVTEPSDADRGITQRLSRALALVDIRLLDHVVVSRDGHVSLAERGWI